MSSISPHIVHPELRELNTSSNQKGADEKSAGMSKDLNRSEGEGMGTTSYHTTINTQTDPKEHPVPTNKSPQEKKTFHEKMVEAGDKIEAKINAWDSKLGVSKKFNEFDQKHQMTKKLDAAGRKASEAIVHFGRALSKGHIKSAFKHSVDAGRISECERKKHYPKGLGPPAWIPESDKEGLVEGSVGKGPTPNEVFAEEERLLDLREDARAAAQQRKEDQTMKT